MSILFSQYKKTQKLQKTKTILVFTDFPIVFSLFYLLSLWPLLFLHSGLGLFVLLLLILLSARLLIVQKRVFSCLLRKGCITVNCPLRTAFAASHIFVWLCFHCHLSQNISTSILLDFITDPLVFNSMFSPM